MKTKELDFHAYANVFPLMEGAEFDALVEDIRQRGQLDPIDVFRDVIIDGRNRYRACLEAGVEPKMQKFTGSDDDALAYVISKNLKRRNLNDDQRRMVAARLANLEAGRPLKSSHSETISRADAAQLVNVDKAGAIRARTVIANARPEIIAAVDRGKLTVAAAAHAVNLPDAAQRDIAKAAMAGQANVVRSALKTAGRKIKEASLAAKQLALPDKKYGVIYADPEWRFEPRSRETGMDRAPDNHYPTSETDAICARPVESIAADDCALFMWATPPMIEDALRVMKAWGFTYKSQVIWAKLRSGGARGTGYWFTGEHEILLLGTRGHVPAPAPGTQHRSVITMSVGEHSEKPEIFHKLIEEYFPTLPRIELNARKPRDGWDVWGDEVNGEKTDA